jgi:two-component sensor histidine kinase/streptogramin lyase
MVQFVWAIAVGAQGCPPSPLFNVAHFGTEDGLPDRQVLSLEQDQRGHIWLATSAGLVRFDGYDFEIYTRKDGLLADPVVRLLRDSDGLLWLEHPDHAYSIFDPLTGQARSLADHFQDQLPAEASPPLLSMHWSPDGSILLGSGNHLLSYQSAAAGFSAHTVLNATALVPVHRGTNGDIFCLARMGGPGPHHSLVKIPATALERGTSTAELVAHGADMIPVARDRHAKAGGIDRSFFYTAYADPATDPPTNTTPKRHFRMYPDGRISSYPEHALYDDGGYLLRSLFPLSLGDDLWMVDGTIRSAASDHPPLSGRVLFDLRSHYPDLVMRVNCLFRDHAGMIWVGTDFGLFNIRMQPDLFQRWLHEPNATGGLGKRIRGMAWYQGQLHVNTELEGYWGISEGGEVKMLGKPGDIRLAMSTHGGLWRHEHNRLVHDTGDTLFFAPHASPWCILPLSDGQLLVGTAEGLHLYHGDSITAPLPQQGFPELERSFVVHMTRDGQERIWACTNSGLYRIDDQGHAIERWWPGGGPGHPNYLPSADIRHFFEDSAGIRWIATATDGVVRWDPRTGTMRVLDKRHGLPHNSIYATYADGLGNLWLPTDRGLVRYHPATGHFTTYTTNDGITHQEFNRLAHAQAPDGRLFFGGLNGITVVDPRRIQSPAARDTIPFVLTRLQRHTKDGNVRIPIDGALVPEVTMHPDDHFLSLDFVLLSYEDPRSILYAWRIDGIDTEWNLQHEPHLRFTTLPYGHHMLHIKARGRDGEWNPTELHIPIHVVRPIYLRWWSIATLLLIVALLVYALFRYRMQQLRNVIRIRDRIALDLHDEVGSTLSSVALFSTVLSERSKDRPAEEVAMLDRIARNSALAMESMNDVVWSVNSRYDRLGDVFVRMEAFVGPIAEANDWELRIDLDERLRDQKLSMNERKDVYLIFKEAVNNAVKHAQCTRLDIAVDRIGDQVRMTIADNGTGMPGTGATAPGRHGLHSMQQRAEAIGGTLSSTSSPTGGTTITLLFHPTAR